MIRGGSPADMNLDHHPALPVVPTNRFKYKYDSPWVSHPAQEADAMVFHVSKTTKAPPIVRYFVGTINLGFAISETKKGTLNFSLLIKRFMSFAKQTDMEFRLEPLNGSGQCITNPSNIPNSKDGIDIYYQDRVVADGIHGKLNVTMSRMMGDMKYMSTPFRKYLNQYKVYVSPAVLGLVDTRIIGVMLQTDPLLTFHDNLKASIMDIMNDDNPMSVFAKRVREVNPTNDNPRFTNGLAIQVAIKDGKQTEQYTEKLAKAMEYVNEHGNHPVLSQCIFVPFGRGASIDQTKFCSLIHMQNEFLHNIQHVELHGLADIDNELHLGNDSDDGEDYSSSIRDLLLDKPDINDQRIFHSIERTMKADTTRALFFKQNAILCNSILSDLDSWLSNKCDEAQHRVTFRKESDVRVFISTVEQRTTQDQVKFNAYASRITKLF
jgi:hypothetical protein